MQPPLRLKSSYAGQIETGSAFGMSKFTNVVYISQRLMLFIVPNHCVHTHIYGVASSMVHQLQEPFAANMQSELFVVMLVNGHILFKPMHWWLL